MAVTANPAGDYWSIDVATTYPHPWNPSNVTNRLFADSMEPKCSRCYVSTWGFTAYGGDAPAEVTNPDEGKEVVAVAASNYGFAALKADGSVTAWGELPHGGQHVDLPLDVANPSPATGGKVVIIATTATAFAAIKMNGAVSAWGDAANGGDASAAGLTSPESGKEVRSIASTSKAFAAIRADGSVVAWGDVARGGGPELPNDVADPNEGEEVITIASTTYAFVALKANGAISAWGNSDKGGTTPPAMKGTPPSGAEVRAIASTVTAFAALKADGSVFAWGNSGNGGTTPIVLSDAPEEDKKVVAVASSDCAFAALRADGSVVSWGCNIDTTPGELMNPVDAQDKVVAIASTWGAFAVLRGDGSVFAWGNNDVGAIAPIFVRSPTTEGDKSVAIASTGYAFAALNAEGAVVAWGQGNAGGGGVPTDVSYPVAGAKVVSIVAARQMFAALKADGTVSSWGTANCGSECDDTSLTPIPSEVKNVAVGKPAVAVATAWYAFAAMKRIPCPVGKYVQGTGAFDSCEPCPAGTYSSEIDAETCIECSSGRYSTKVGASSNDTCRLIPPDNARCYVAQHTDDKLPIRVDDSVDDETYFFVDSIGRMRVNSNVYDEAEEVAVVNGTTRLRGDVFLGGATGSMNTLQRQCQSKLQHSTPGLQVQREREELNTDTDVCTIGTDPTMLCRHVILATPVVKDSATILVTFNDGVVSVENLLQVPVVWIGSLAVQNEVELTGFLLRGSLNSTVSSAVVFVDWVVIGTPVTPA